MPKRTVIESMENLVRPAFDQIENIRGGSGQHFDIGFLRLHEMLNYGLKPGRVFVIGARPGVGKTALALQIARSVASGLEPFMVGYVVTRPHATVQELALRVILSAASVSESQIHAGFTRSLAEKTVKAGSMAEQLPLFFCGAQGRDLKSVKKVLKR